MAVTATLTGSIGAGSALTAKVFTDVLSFTVDSSTNVISLVKEGQVTIFVSIASATTFTATKSGSTYTITIS